VTARRTRSWLAALTVAIAVSCAVAPRGLLTSVSPPPPEIDRACALASTKCSHCHPIERVMVSRGIGAARWSVEVEQMRLKPSSGISTGDADIIFQCLRFVDEHCTDCKQGRS
jgi:hypothetical protein